MNVGTFFLYFHGAIHRRVAGDLKTLAPEQLRARPHPRMNSMVWLAWHIARCEDVGVNRLVVDRPQVFDEEGDWPGRLNLPQRQVGVGMEDIEVDELTAAIDIEGLRDYWRAVGERTRMVVQDLDPAVLDEVPDPAHVRHVLYGEQMVPDSVGWISDFYADQTKGWFLGHLAMRHHYTHWGHAAPVMAMLGIRQVEAAPPRAG